MPELPEVETTRRGIEPHLTGRRITGVVVRQPRLRWPIPDSLPRQILERRIHGVDRRGKYLLLDCGDITLLVHLGMSGSLRIVENDSPPRLHDHVDLALDSGKTLRLHDPRRFGALLCFDPREGPHPLLAELGPEPLGDQFDGDYLHRQTRRRRTAIKSLIMDSHVVVGVGNIYASESLFLAGIRPRRAAGRITRAEAFRLVEAIRAVLTASIEQGGTTLRDFVHEDGSHGYFSQQLRVYGRAGLPCLRCGTAIRQVVVGQRSTFYCPHCQER
ncbi:MULTISPECIES: bifunctional DNA-formamidopyrimidine glycosylase/DNA-(apurinic or apyrimidinic site) lyase [Ectothiorhodospira]|uniref:bifunctional DNA-formamidopyrimidine glycosylase/DNA-(apurinic or apyrimidinic site) lyase n=1 Tax=Ectothiorhodospira TaxID=1051 RepID=UPI00024A80F3|nr:MULTISPECIES: bifunctional DNA-formamidopyrimidine glycosylase/DNA-(apurinic or apyrimidinic site) lyase [Ectothiorhodospira]EHQ51447.1 DNA-formamidopyrimidine glycosylase [Ectothiorhodospira sp. PHS-1]MCG5513481.1 bifunctional DNA-formamidopyrimidine glycosylase/DNA-(apurinic or apyrimidinic site) lyase [Ectothiorhodospira shaposhnikovii]